MLFAFALMVSAVVIFHRLGEAPLGGDDCYYAQVSKEMAQSGDYLTPRNGGRPDFHTSKPPVLYWMNIATGKLFGFTNAAMRLPSAVLGFVGVVCCALFVSRYFSPTAGLFSVIILTFSQQYLYHARSARSCRYSSPKDESLEVLQAPCISQSTPRSAPGSPIEESISYWPTES